MENFTAARACIVVGPLLGLDRKIRGHVAGLRTHGVVSLSSAVITISALLLLEQLRSAEAQPDPLGVVQGLVQAIGFIAAGLIFVKGGDVRNLTSAANIWLATAIGIACGAGQDGLIVLAAGFGLLLVIGLRAADQWLPEQSAQPTNKIAASALPMRTGAKNWLGQMMTTTEAKWLTIHT